MGFEDTIRHIIREELREALRPAPAPAVDTPPEVRPLLTVREAANMRGCSPKTIRTAILAGRLKASRPAGARDYLIRTTDFWSWATASAPPPPKGTDADIDREAAEVVKSLGRGR